MSASQQAKEAGFTDLAHLSRATTVSRNTLSGWHKNKPVLFALVLLGAAKSFNLESKKQCNNS
jgi:hypothetical protein